MNITLDQLVGQPDWAITYRWNVTFLPPLALPFPGGLDVTNIRCESAALPKSTGSVFEVTIRGLTDNVNPGIWKTAGTIKLVFVETVDNAILNWIQYLREAIWRPGTGSGLNKADLLFPAVRLERLDRSENPVRQYTLENSLLADYDPGGDLGPDAGLVKPSITIAYPNYTEVGLPVAAPVPTTP
jgi:hypothetical protein